MTFCNCTQNNLRKASGTCCWKNNNIFHISFTWIKLQDTSRWQIIKFSDHNIQYVINKSHWLLNPALSCYGYTVCSVERLNHNKFSVALTTLCQRPVVVYCVDSYSAASEQLCPVYSVVVTEVGILADVHTAITDLSERAQTQWGKGGDVHHHQRKTPLVRVLEDRRGYREKENRVKNI